MRNVVVFKEPKFKPMPSELTPAVINGATLPVKVEAAKRAIAACCDLSELLTWKDKLAALAAAAKMARMPEMARDVNRVHKEAIFRMGEILLQYNGKPQKGCIGRGQAPSERTKAAQSVGITKHDIVSIARLASAKKIVRERILQNDNVPAVARIMVKSTPIVSPRHQGLRGGYSPYSDAGSIVFQGLTLDEQRTKSRGGRGIVNAASILRTIEIDKVALLTFEEKQRARKLVVEMQEILDKIDQQLGPT